MVDRIIIEPAQIPLDTDLMLTNKNMMVGLGYLMQAVLGTSTLADGLACTPTSPASLAVKVAGGSIYSLAQIDATAYGSISADTTDQIVKQGIVIPSTTFNCPAPATAGQSVVYLVQAIYQDVDSGSTVRPYYNATNPSVPYSGPANSGAPDNTLRKGVCTLTLKTGVAATTGSQVTPTPDAGYTGLYAVTVANGQSTVTSGNIVPLTSAPFIGPKLPAVISAVQGGGANYAVDTSGAANTVTVGLTPTPSSPPRWVVVKIANTTTGATVLNVNGLGNVAVHDQNGNPLSPGALSAGGVYLFLFDGVYWQVAGVGPAAGARTVLSGNKTFYVSPGGNDANPGTSGSPWLTLQHAADFIASSIDLGGFNVNVSCAAGTYTGGVLLQSPFTGNGVVTFVGDVTNPSNCTLSTAADCFSARTGAIVSVQGFKLTASNGNTISAYSNGIINISGNMEFSAVTLSGASHIYAAVGGTVRLLSSYKITGSAAYHVLCEVNATVSNQGSATVTLTGTPAFSSFALATTGGVVIFNGTAYSGSASGSYFTATLNGVINTGTGNLSYLPGNGAGAATTGGQYA